MRSKRPSIAAAQPFIMPDCMLSTVFVPISFSLRLMAISGRLAARCLIASAEI